MESWSSENPEEQLFWDDRVDPGYLISQSYKSGITPGFTWSDWTPRETILTLKRAQPYPTLFEFCAGLWQRALERTLQGTANWSGRLPLGPKQKEVMTLPSVVFFHLCVLFNAVCIMFFRSTYTYDLLDRKPMGSHLNLPCPTLFVHTLQRRTS